MNDYVIHALCRQSVTLVAAGIMFGASATIVLMFVLGFLR